MGHVKLGLVGYPVEHSLSPRMQQAAMAHLGISGEYLLLPTKPAELPARLREVAANYAGVNVTVPYKRSVMDLLDDVSEDARKIGAVNTIVNEDGYLRGYNTDAAGFYWSLKRHNVLPGEALVLGAGGAARAVVYALVEKGWLVGVANRTLARAEELAQQLGAWLVAPAKLEKAVRRTPLLINATSVGLEDGASSPLPPGVLPEAGVVVDLVYSPLRTKLLADAAAAGLETIDGLQMLLGQGMRSFELWTGRKAPLEVMERALGKVV